LIFGPKSGFKNECRARAGFGLVISGSAMFGLQHEARLQLWAGIHNRVYIIQSLN